MIGQIPITPVVVSRVRDDYEMGPIHRLLAWAVGANLALPSAALVPWRHEPMGSVGTPVGPPVEPLAEEPSEGPEPAALTQRAGGRSLLGCKLDNFHHNMNCGKIGQPSAPPKVAMAAAAAAAAAAAPTATPAPAANVSTKAIAWQKPVCRLTRQKTLAGHQDRVHARRTKYQSCSEWST